MGLAIQAPIEPPASVAGAASAAAGLPGNANAASPAGDSTAAPFGQALQSAMDGANGTPAATTTPAKAAADPKAKSDAKADASGEPAQDDDAAAVVDDEMGAAPVRHAARFVGARGDRFLDRARADHAKFGQGVHYSPAMAGFALAI